MAIDFLQGAREIIRIVDGVGVGEEEIASAGSLCSGPTGVVLAGEASATGEVERWGVEQRDSVVGCGGFGGDFAGSVG